ncbi:MAG: hypothetical protein H5U40_08295, partial [Polyangiaceae bacterium]|nr:hypothetical protein [Polyangiaceae bacterium]
AFLAGGGEVLMEPLYLGLQRLGIAAPNALQIGEGAAYVVVEREEHARAREARVHGVIRGYGSAFEPPEREAQLVHGSADAVRRALEGALADAGIDASEVDAVCSSHGGLEVIDQSERQAIALVFGENVRVAAPKRLFGETFGAAGALGLSAALAWMQGAPVAPLLSGNAEGPVRTVAVVSVGFYGNASAIIVSA